LIYLFGDFILDPDRCELRRGSSPVAIEPQVFDLLAYLIRHRERVVSRDELIESIWGGRIVSESALSTRINAVRSAIGDSGTLQRLIKTVPRRGIRFVGDVREEQQAAVEGYAGRQMAQPLASLSCATPTRVHLIGKGSITILRRCRRSRLPLRSRRLVFFYDWP
jgi:DNA-binding winged helix-turn-helix (wHTH) protein